MLNRLVEQRKAISAANSEANKSFDLTPSQWNLAETVINLPKPFEEATEDISSKSSSMILFISVVNSLSKLLQVDEEDIYCLSTILDPRFKNKVFSSQAEIYRSQEKLILKCEEILQSSTPESSLSSSDIPSPKRAQANHKNDTNSILWATVDEMMKENDSEPDDDYTTCEKMVHCCLGEPNADYRSNP